MEKVVIRYAKISDLEKLHEFVNELSTEKTFITYQGEKISVKEEADFLEANIKKIKNKTGVSLVLFIDNKLAGTANATTNRGIREHVANLGIMLRKEFRGKGYGEMLFSKLIEETKKSIKGVRLLTLDVFANNFAINLYKKLGFKECGRQPGGIKYKNKYVDSINMCLEL